MGEIVSLNTITTVPEPPEQLLEKAKEWGMEQCIVIGTKEDGEFIWGGSFSERETIHWLLALAQKANLADIEV